MLDALTLVFAHSQLTGDRLQNVKKIVNTVLGKEVIKPKTDAYGGKVLPTDFLLEDLAEKNKKIIKSARVSDTVMYTLIAPRKWHRSNDYYQRLYTSSVRARGQWGLRARFGVTRGMPYSWPTRQPMQPRFNRLPGDYGNTELPLKNMRGTRGRGRVTAPKGFSEIDSPSQVSEFVTDVIPLLDEVKLWQVI